MVRICLRFTMVVILLMSLVGIVSCGGESPEGVVKAFLQAVNAGEFDKAEEYLDSSQVFTPEVPYELEGNIEKIETGLVQTFGEGIEMAAVSVTLTVSPALYSSSPVWYQEHIMGFALVKSAQGWKITSITR